jgi:hypothetical protein
MGQSKPMSVHIAGCSFNNSLNILHVCHRFHGELHRVRNRCMNTSNRTSVGSKVIAVMGQVRKGVEARQGLGRRAARLGWIVDMG